MIQHLLDRRSVEYQGLDRGLLLVVLMEGAFGVEVLDGVLGNRGDGEATLGGQNLQRTVSQSNLYLFHATSMNSLEVLQV